MKQSTPRPAIPGPVNGSTLGYAPQYGEVTKVAGDVKPATHEQGRVTGAVNPANETVLENPNKYDETKKEMNDENQGTGAGQYGNNG